MVENWSGVIVSTLCPRARSSATVVVSVRTTPLTCGAQASLTSAIFIRRSSGRNRGRSALATAGHPGRRGLHRLEPHLLGPVDDLHAAVKMLDQRGAALHPIAVVVIGDRSELADLGGVNMAAYHSIHAPLDSGVGDHFLIFGDELDGVLHALLEVRGE